MITIIKYNNKALSNNEIKTLINNRPYSYIVATKGLETHRYRLIPDHQGFKDKCGNESKSAIFKNVLSEWTRPCISIASKGEVKTILNRSIEAISKDNNELQNVFKKDIKQWSRTLSELTECGVNLTTDNDYTLKGVPINEFLLKSLKKLQQEFYKNLKEENKELLENAIRHYVENYYCPTSTIIMEGFTFLTKLQEYFLKIADSKGCNIIILTPYNIGQSKGFKLIDQTYSVFRNANVITRTTKDISNMEDINFLQKNIFTEDFTSKRFNSANNIELNGYLNTELEIRACLDKLQNWFDEGYLPDEVAVVMRRPEEFKDTLHDYLAMNPLYYYKKRDDGSIEKLPVDVYIPSRLLLLTPLGRFILLLYEIWIDDHLEIHPDQLETILSSGWLGVELQDSTELFKALKNQYFIHSKYKKEWFGIIDDILKDLDNKNMIDRLPSHLLNSDNKPIINKWKETINLLESVCTNLFNNINGSIGDHIRKLQFELHKLMPEDIRKSEKLILVKIQEVFKELEQAYSIKMTTNEFSEAINALTHERKHDEEEEEIGSGKLWLTSPEGIDNLSRKSIIYLGVDNQRVPSIPSIPWPLYYDNRDENIIKERYMFLTVLRAVSEKLVMSYAKSDGKHLLLPSIYMEDIANVFQIGINNKNIINELDISKAPQIIQSKPYRAKPKEYHLNELIHYGLCPLRYKLEKLHPEAKTYRDYWQLKFLVLGVWLDMIYEDIKEDILSNGYKKSKFLESMKKVKSKVRKLFPSFTNVEWNEVEKQLIKHNISYLIENDYKRYPLQIKKGINTYFNVLLDDEAERNIKIKISIPFTSIRGRYEYTENRSNRIIEWLIYGKRPDNPNDFIPKKEADDILLFENQYHAVKFWETTIKGFFRNHTNGQHNSDVEHYKNINGTLINWIKSIEEGKFPGISGDQCNYCSVKLECLGIGG